MDANVIDEYGTRYTEGTNNYIDDDPIPNTDAATSEWMRAHSVIKYKNQAVPKNDETPPGTKGPNRSCPDPIVPLTNDHALLTSKIDALMQWEGGGTNTVEGVAWGWRVLSPGLPFTEGAAYGAVRKVIILFSDGANTVGGETGTPAHPNTGFMSEYNSYGFARYGRFPQENATSGTTYINGRMSAACTLVKNAGVEIYVVGFGVSGQALTRLTSCASAPENVFNIARGSNLKPTFSALAREMSSVRLSR